MIKNSKDMYKQFQTLIQYSFNDTTLLDTALTHSSYANEHKGIGSLESNERLEFLGDSVLGVIITSYLYERNPHLSEGDLTKIRASVVSEPSLAQVARKINLGRVLKLGKGEERTGGRKRASVLADALESLIAAIYLDGGLDKASRFVLKSLDETIGKVMNGKILRDYKTSLQEQIQKELHGEISYSVVDEKGPDHNKDFVVEVYFNEKTIGNGIGKSKKEAEQQAAKNALENLYE